MDIVQIPEGISYHSLNNQRNEQGEMKKYKMKNK